MLGGRRILLCGVLYCGCVLLARAADTDYLRTTIQNHFSKNRHHLINPDYKRSARDFIVAQFTRFGLQVITQDFQGAGNQDLIGQTFTNVIGILKGSRFGHPDDALTAIGAHYDTVRDTSGVDDNGAGVAAMLETARRLTSEYQNVKNTVIFGAFDIEEYMFDVDGVGSQKLVSEWLPAWLQKNYGSAAQQLKFNGVIVLDTVMNFNSSAKAQIIPGSEALFKQAFPVAYNDIKSDNFLGDFLAVIYRKTTNDSKLASGLQVSWTKGSHPEFEIESFGLPITDPDLDDQKFVDFLRSDHYHFWKNGLSAIFITDSADLRGLMEKCYHHQCDNSDVMLTDENVAFLGKISDSMTDVVGRMSGGTHHTGAAPSLRCSALLLAILVLTTLL